MRFVTLTFLLFLIASFCIYWRLKDRRWQNGYLVLASYVFYGWWDYRFCSLMVASTLIDYISSLFIWRSRKISVRKSFLVLSICANLGLLGFFKYYGFFVENVSALLQTFGLHGSIPVLQIVLPVGISFYTFQTMSYTIDVFNRKLRPTTSLVDYAAYVSFFPQLVAGPIERGASLLPQFLRERRFSPFEARDGCRQMLWGAFKKMVVADNLVRFVDPVFADVGAHRGVALVQAVICFAFQIYCDFSAYSDMAIGTAKLFGFSLQRNFAFPYFSQNPSEFWRRWHISLSTWFRDYVYIPLGGSREGPVRRVLNALITFTVSGLWHGPSWSFAFWGFLNGVAILPASFSGTKVLGPRDKPGGAGVVPNVKVLAKMAACFLFTLAAWVFFRAESFRDACLLFRRLRWVVTDVHYGNLSALENGVVLLYILPVVLFEWLTRDHHHPFAVLPRFPRVVRWGAYTVVIWSILCFMPERASSFIYFQF